MTKKTFRALSCLLLAAAICLPLAACGGASSSQSGTDASALSGQISSALSDLKACRGEPLSVAEQVIADSGIQDHLDDIGMTDEELCRAYLDDFDYEVGDVHITGSTAQAKLTLRRRSITAIVKSYVASGKMADVAEAKDALLSAISGTEAGEASVTLNISQKDGSWDVIDALSASLQRGCL